MMKNLMEDMRKRPWDFSADILLMDRWVKNDVFFLSWWGFWKGWDGLIVLVTLNVKC